MASVPVVRLDEQRWLVSALWEGMPKPLFFGAGAQKAIYPWLPVRSK
jgi:hypothetical protein